MTEHRSFIENLPNFRGDSQWGDRAIDEILRLRAALRQVTRRRTAWLSIGAINNVAEIRVERELFEEWVRLIPALEGRE